MKINREELLEILTLIKPGLAKNTMVETMTHFIFTGTNIVTFNAEVFVSNPYKTDFQTTVKAKEFYAVLKKLPDEEVELFLDGNHLKMKGKKREAGLSVAVENVLAEVIESLNKQIINAKWKSVPNNFNHGIDLCAFSASKDTTKEMLLCLKVEGNEINCGSGQRLSVFKLEAQMDSFMTKAVDISKLSVFFDLEKYAVSDSWVHFMTDNNTVFSLRLIVGNFPNFNEVIKTFSFTIGRLKLPESSLDIIDFIKSVGDKEYLERRMEVVINKNSMVYKLVSNKGDYAKEEIEINYSGEPFGFTVHPDMFAEVIERAQTMIIGDKMIKFISGNFQHYLLIEEMKNETTNLPL